MRWRFCTAAIVLLASSLSVAQASYRLRTKTAAEYASAQRQVVSMYCRLDFEGSQLNEQGWQKMRPLMFAPTSPEFNAVEVVSRYQISPAEGISPSVTVSYNVLGRYQMGYGYTPSPDVRDVTFRVEDKKGDMLITSVEPSLPRISKRVAVQWLKTQLEKVQNPIEKAQIESSLKLLDPPAAATAAPASETK